tara:strand:- start:53 stop:1123 length:1071 start_codon:yes stop_codon:yes gene_type:complete
MNITYLIGAGASYEALPIVKDIGEKLQYFKDNFNFYTEKEKIDFLDTKDRLIDKIINVAESQKRTELINLAKSFYNDIEWLQKNVEIHSSIDTFAKKLFLRKELDKLNKLKFILSSFFVFLEVKNLDKRYDSFFASILEDINNYPNNINILSWNYDSQIEKAHYNFAEKDGSYSPDPLNIQYRGDIKGFSCPVDGFCVHKLNGTTKLKDSQYMEEIYNVNGKNEIALGFNILNEYENILSGVKKPNMTFAWENFDENLPFFKNLKVSISKTEILIVIGYSFPFFNRKIDKYIFNSMRKLEKIYVQDPNYSDEVIEKIKGLIPNKKYSKKAGSFLLQKEIEYQSKKFVDQFFIPIEF